MYAAAHTSLALIAKRQHLTVSLVALMVTAQAAEVLWVGLTSLGIEHPTVDTQGALHLEYLPYSHSLLVGFGIGAALWALLRYVVHRPDIAGVFGCLAASHIVLDLIQHEPNIRVLPWMAHPTLGLNLQANPWLDAAVETALCVACWAYYRGSLKLLAALIALNILNLPLMLGGESGATAMAQHRLLLPGVIAVTIVLAWAVVGRYAHRQTDQQPAHATPRHAVPA